MSIQRAKARKQKPGKGSKKQRQPRNSSAVPPPAVTPCRVALRCAALLLSCKACRLPGQRCGPSQKQKVSAPRREARATQRQPQQVRAWCGAYLQRAKARSKTSKKQPRVLHTVQACLSAPCTAHASLFYPFAVKGSLRRFAPLTVQRPVVAHRNGERLKENGLRVWAGACAGGALTCVGTQARASASAGG